jgi:dolichol-phosphate mannosyltransferase
MNKQNDPADKDVFIIIPTYNEVENVRLLLNRIHQINSIYRVIVVDDNSPDGTAEIVQELGRRWANLAVLRRPGKSGIGSAIRDGLRLALSHSDCRYIVTLDADFTHNPDDIPRLLAAAPEADVVQGSRYCKGGKVVGWSIYRKLLSRTANFLYRRLFSLKQKEITTFFRVYSRRSAEIIVSQVQADKHEFGFASALCFKDEGLKVKEIPIQCANRTKGKSKVKTADIWFSGQYLWRTFFKRRFKSKG